MGDDESETVGSAERLADGAAAMGATWVLASTLLDRGWEGTVSAEVLSSELRTLPITDIVRRIHDTIAPYWR